MCYEDSLQNYKQFFEEAFHSDQSEKLTKYFMMIV